MQVSLEELAARVLNRPCAIRELSDEAKKLPELADIIRALALFAKSLTPNGKYWKQGARYVLYPNFVTFSLRHKQKHHVTLSLRGHPSEFDVSSELPLKEGRAGAYSECNLNNPRQLAVAAAYVQHAYQLYKRGGARVRKRVTRLEVPLENKLA